MRGAFFGAVLFKMCRGGPKHCRRSLRVSRVGPKHCGRRLRTVTSGDAQQGPTKGSHFWACPSKGSDFCMSSQKLAKGSHFWNTGDIMPKLEKLSCFFYHNSLLKFDVKMHFFGRSWVGALLVQFLVKGFEVLAWLRTLCPNIGRVRTFARAFISERPAETQNATDVVSERPWRPKTLPA